MQTTVSVISVKDIGEEVAAAVVKYDTKVTLQLHDHDRFIYWVESKGSTCERGRRVDLFEVRPGADRKLGTARSKYRSGHSADAVITAKKWGRDDVVYAMVRREVHDEFVCGGDRSELHDDRPNVK